MEQETKSQDITTYKKIILDDYLLMNQSRQASLMGRKEVLTGKAKFGIFGDGKELAQIAMSKVFQEGDFRSGYYRDQTFMMAIGQLSLQQWFAGLYGHTDIQHEPMSAGRQMGGHFSTPLINPDGSWRNHTTSKNSSSDISPTAGQMPRLLGLAYASHFYRNNKDLQTENFTKFSNKGNEVAFGTIGDASTSEGLFWETLNAAGVLQVPMLVSVWDDGHGISVPKKYQTTKESISEILKGFQRDKNHKGFEILKTKGWDYVHLINTYEQAIAICREQHVPVLVHVEEVTQPQGHSTSGSHERYKSKERLQWEQDFDCIKQFKEFVLANALASEVELEAIEEKAKTDVREAKNNAWKAFISPIQTELNDAVTMLENLASELPEFSSHITDSINELKRNKEPLRKDIHVAVKKALRLTKSTFAPEKNNLVEWLQSATSENKERYSSHLHSQSASNALNISPVAMQYDIAPKAVDGREVLKENFEFILAKYPEVVIFGEDAGRIGDVNQGLEGVQAKFGELRVFDTGIREATIMGQAIGLAMRGIRPIAEIQYLDYLLYAIQLMSDDLATLQYRTKGTQKSPVIIRTRGHRLEGVWHSGSPMGMIINAIRGIYVCVPRNMTIAAGFYNTLLEADEPAIVIECLNGYRLKENLPSNIGEFKLPLGKIEVLNHGSDITLVTYGSSVRIAQEAIAMLNSHGISIELIDVQTLLPFDLKHEILESVKKTNKLVVLDEDVPGGCSAYLSQQIIEGQGAFQFLDATPLTIASKAHRPAYGTDGDYFSKPSADDVFDAIYGMMNEYSPTNFPKLY
jgi:2-oxoisovalerate dehydrogenase E1 component